MKIAFAFLVFFATLFSAEAQSTDFLLLKRGSNQKSQIRFYPGEEITYKSKKLGYFVTDQIVKLDDEYIYLTENILAPADITEVGVRKKDKRNHTLRNLTTLFLSAGTVLLGAEVFNSLYQDRPIDADGGVFITSGILIGTGLALLPVRYKTFKNTTGYGIQIIQMRMD